MYFFIRDPDPSLQPQVTEQPIGNDDDDDDDDNVEGFTNADVGEGARGEITNIEVIELQSGKPPQQQHTGVTTSVTVVDDDGKKLHVCHFCEKAFKKSSHLKQHIRSHTGEYMRVHNL